MFLLGLDLRAGKKEEDTYSPVPPSEDRKARSKLGEEVPGLYLGWVVEVERLVEAEVDKTQESGIELGEGGHDPVVHICWMLGA